MLIGVVVVRATVRYAFKRKDQTMATTKKAPAKKAVVKKAAPAKKPCAKKACAKMAK